MHSQTREHFRRGGKIILPFQVLSRDPVIKDRLTREKTNRSVLAQTPPLYMGDTQRKMSKSPGGFEFRLKTIFPRKEEGSVSRKRKGPQKNRWESGRFVRKCV